MVRAYEDYVDVKDSKSGALKANLRVGLYLEDNGAAAQPKKTQNSLQQAREMKMAGGGSSQIGPDG